MANSLTPPSPYHPQPQPSLAVEKVSLRETQSLRSLPQLPATSPLAPGFTLSVIEGPAASGVTPRPSAARSKGLLPSSPLTSHLSPFSLPRLPPADSNHLHVDTPGAPFR